MITFEDLKDFLLNRMRMSHIYQPVTIRALIENNGEASVRTIAKEFLSYDEVEIAYYSRIARRYPKQTLEKHGVITTTPEGSFRLNLDLNALTEEQRAELIRICNEKTEHYIHEYDGEIGALRFDPRFRDSSHTGEAPRKTSGIGSPHSANYCPFCNSEENVIAFSDTAKWTLAPKPAAQFHSLIVPRRHVVDMEGLSAEELEDLFALVKTAKHQLETLDHTILSFNTNIIEDKIAGQEKAHLVVHVIPRRDSDASASVS